MAAFNYDTTYYDNSTTAAGVSSPTVIIRFDPGATSYSSNLPDSYFEPKPDEEGMLQALKEQRRQWSIEALLDLKYLHDRAASPASRCDVAPKYAHRPQAQRRTATAVRNWRRR